MNYPQHLTSLRVFLSLLPREKFLGCTHEEKEGVINQEKRRMMKLLLYPPDLFAFTSTILGTTGAYYLVVSPARDLKNLTSTEHIWAPKIIYENTEDKKPLVDFRDGWAKKVSELGKDWRNFLNENFSYYENILNNPSEKSIEEILKINSDDCEFPKDIYKMLKLFLEGCDDENINELMCKRDIVVDTLIQIEEKTKGSQVNRADFEDSKEEELNSRLNRLWNAYCCLISLHAIADEACLGFGIRDDVFTDTIKEEEKKPLQIFAESKLEKYGTLSTIHPDRCRVLPKRHTPDVGMTLRNISSNLAFTKSSVQVKWRKSVPTYLTEKICKNNNVSSLNILLIPCPMKISARDFKVIAPEEIPQNNENETYFEYAPVNDYDRWNHNDKKEYQSKREGLENWLYEVFKNAINEAGRIDLVIMPETALSCDKKDLNDEDHITQLERAIKKINNDPTLETGISGYIVGASLKRESNNGHRRLNRNFVVSKMCEITSDFPNGNFAKIDNYDTESDYIQHKHHRWRLTNSQIIQYQLGGILTPEKFWWEGSKISRRKVTFINIGKNVTICPLVCEDLARQEPISDLIRAVGPSLVVSLLMDGPQLADRWSAGYAGILADDPRSSVLTLTCAGLVDRWKSSYRSTTKTVAYWKDNLNYRQEIELEKDKEAIILYLNVTSKKETTADGREEHIGTPYLLYGGMAQV